jgi:nitrogen fixation protein NifU and related proteins
MSYSDKVMDHYENPRNVGRLDKESSEVGTGMVGAPACGDVMLLQIKVNDNGIIEDAKFKTYGCGSAIASSSLLTEWVKGRSVKSTGCSGYAYIVEPVDEKQEWDNIFQDKGIDIFVDGKSLVYIDGSEVDYIRNGLNAGLEFNNPNIKAECGCGESFTI